MNKTNGLSECRQGGPSVIDFHTLSLSKTCQFPFCVGVDYLIT